MANHINNTYAAYEYLSAAVTGGKQAFSISNVASTCHSILSGKWLGQALTKIPPISYAVNRVGNAISIPSEKLAHWAISRSIMQSINSQIKSAFASSYAKTSYIFVDTLFRSVAPESVINAADHPIGQKLLSCGRNSGEKALADKLSQTILKTLDPLIIAGGSKAIGRLAASATESTLQVCAGIQIQKFVLAQMEANYPEAKSGVDTINELTTLKSQMMLTALLISFYTVPVIYRRCISSAAKEELKKNLVNLLLEKTIGEISGPVTEYVLKGLLSKVVDGLIDSTLIDTHLLKSAYDTLYSKQV